AAQTRQHRIGAVAGLFQIVERSQRLIVLAFRGEVESGKELVAGSGSLAVGPVLIADPASRSQNDGHSGADRQRTEVPPDLLCPFRTDFLVYLANETVVCHGPAAKAKLMFAFVVLALLVGFRAICKTRLRNKPKHVSQSAFRSDNSLIQELATILRNPSSSRSFSGPCAFCLPVLFFFQPWLFPPAPRKRNRCPQGRNMC